VGRLLPAFLEEALSVEIIALFKNHARLDAGRIEELTGANRSTLKVRLRELVIAGRLRKHGKARATWYSI
jgi:DNA-binding IclR family transcriptional regulator